MLPEQTAEPVKTSSRVPPDEPVDDLDRPVWVLGRDTAEEWVGRPLTDQEAVQLGAAIPHSPIREAIPLLAEAILPVIDGDNDPDDEDDEAGYDGESTPRSFVDSQVGDDLCDGVAEVTYAAEAVDDDAAGSGDVADATQRLVTASRSLAGAVQTVLATQLRSSSIPIAPVMRAPQPTPSTPPPRPGGDPVSSARIPWEDWQALLDQGSRLEDALDRWNAIGGSGDTGAVQEEIANQAAGLLAALKQAQAATR